MYTLHNRPHDRNRRSSLSTSKLSISQPKKKYLEVVSNTTPQKTLNSSHHQLRSSVVSLPANQQDHGYQQRIRGDNNVKFIRSSSVHSQTVYRHCPPSPQPKVIVRQIITTIPVNFHYPNQSRNSLPLKPSSSNPKYPIKAIFQTPSKTDIILHSMMNNRSINGGINPQISSSPTPAPFQPFYNSHNPSEQFRFSLNMKTEQDRRINPNRLSVPYKRNDPENTLKYQKVSPITSQPQSQVKISNQIYMKKQLQEPELHCSSNSNKVPEDLNCNNNIKIPKESTQNIQKYNSLTITKQDKQSNLKENLEIGKNCLCQKIIEFTKCEDIKIKKNNTNKRQVLEPKKNLLLSN